jgi:hypothetical protein
MSCYNTASACVKQLMKVGGRGLARMIVPTGINQSDSVETTNEMQPCNRIYYSTVK